MKAIGFWKSIKVSWTANKGISYLFLLLIPFLVLTSNIAAASTNIDSLKSLIPKLSANKKIDVLQSISKYYLFISSDSCLKYGKQTLLLANELQDVEQEALAYKRMGYACYIVGDYDQGIYFYEKSLSRYMQIKEYLDAAVITNFIGAAYFQKSDYSKAISYYIKTEKCCDTLINISLNQTSVKRLYAILYTNFGLLYYKLDSINKPLEYFNRALYFAETINDSTRISASYSNLGMIYKAQKKFSLALSFYYKSLAISQEIDNQGYEHATLNNIANIYSQKGLIDSALVYFYKAMDIANKKGDKYGLSLINRNITDIHLIKQNFDDALNSSTKALEYSLETGATDEIYSNYKLLSQVYKQMGKFDSAYYYYVKYSILVDSVKNIKTRAEVAEIQSKYESNKKEKENTILKNNIKLEKGKSYLLTIIAIGLFTIGVISLILFYFIRKNVITKKLLAESETTRYEVELEAKKRELTLGALSLSRNIEFINSLISELKELADHVSNDGVQPLNNIVNKLSKQQSDNNWKEFEKRFSEIHSKFYSDLINDFPNLTQSEVRLSAFLKLGMNTKEICSITFQSVRAVEAARLRLRKKLNLTNSENLNLFFQKY